MKETMIVADCPVGTVCRFNGEWGVIGRLGVSRRAREFDRWYGPPIALKGHEIVEVFEPRKEVEK